MRLIAVDDVMEKYAVFTPRIRIAVARQALAALRILAGLEAFKISSLQTYPAHYRFLMNRKGKAGFYRLEESV